MTAKLLTARPVVEKIKQDLLQRCGALKARGIMPTMGVILVGDNPASIRYIRNKKKLCEEIGARFFLHQLDQNISPSEFVAIVNSLNEDPNVHGIIIQLPVSEKLKELDIRNLVIPEKDIDGFHGKNTQLLYAGTTDMSLLLPCTPKGIISLLKHYGIEVEGKQVVVVGRSLIVGKPLAMLLSNFNATVTMAHSKTRNLSDLTRRAELVISAIGQPRYLDAGFFDKKTGTIVIDVGINTIDGKLTGDVNFDEVSPLVKAISPVPGGVGPMTVVSLIENLITACENQYKGKL